MCFERRTLCGNLLLFLLSNMFLLRIIFFGSSEKLDIFFTKLGLLNLDGGSNFLFRIYPCISQLRREIRFWHEAARGFRVLPPAPGRTLGKMIGALKAAGAYYLT